MDLDKDETVIQNTLFFEKESYNQTSNTYLMHKNALQKREMHLNLLHEAFEAVTNESEFMSKTALNDISVILSINPDFIEEIPPFIVRSIFDLLQTDDMKYTNFILKALYQIMKFSEQYTADLISLDLVSILIQKLPLPTACNIIYLLATRNPDTFEILSNRDVGPILYNLYSEFSTLYQEHNDPSIGEVTKNIMIALIPFTNYLDIPDDLLLNLTNTILNQFPYEEYTFLFFILTKKELPLQRLMESDLIQVLIHNFMFFLEVKVKMITLFSVLANRNDEIAMALIQWEISKLILHFLEIGDMSIEVLQLSTDLVKYSQLHVRNFLNGDFSERIRKIFKKGSFAIKCSAVSFIMKCMELCLYDNEIYELIEQTNFLEYVSQFLSSTNDEVIATILNTVGSVWNEAVVSPEGRPQFLSNLVDEFSTEEIIEILEGHEIEGSDLVCTLAKDLLEKIHNFV
ncbi:hypothetical protein TVAG_049710 [Trichomonas vaginalis G3]|uniref:Uncharacterized protein n=1 Tax=Trichomonas vaginalis (strain ATCC PRA-98 / G3) TaxID=412133 RepID=A2EVW6_TRIV3|nr:armadillo (ARM) repeat-containing protein family [Trichomonas vaginalis G3]EAY03187.1 hypothetical protein TVAG_049710 [Trichomonas vaginalis G3]KAI5520328.1 armadillo (ARM) repeat-containing protein family [Trichomonas vaginalis G3]|eukprot:XP_001315410.1 hypothetical protein [Trichomonas vaginalis G3]